LFERQTIALFQHRFSHRKYLKELYTPEISFHYESMTMTIKLSNFVSECMDNHSCSLVALHHVIK